MHPALRTHDDDTGKAISPHLLWFIWLFWLFFLTQPLAALLALPMSAGTVLQLSGMALFTALYLWISWHEAYRLTRAVPVNRGPDVQWWLVFGLFLALSIALVIGSGANAIGAFIYVAACTAARLTGRQAAALCVGLMLLVLLLSAVNGLSLSAVGNIFFIIPAVGVIVHFFGQAVRVNQELRLARREIARLAVSEERLRFARDLHDLLGHTLSLIALKSELAGQLIAEDPTRAQREVGEVEAAARTALQEVREAVAGYREATLRGELEHAHELLAAAGIECVVRDEAGALPPPIETLLGWVLREGITNMIRHSRARHCLVALTRSDGGVRMSLTDDGRGSAHASPASDISGAPSHGNGLRGIAERVAAHDGRCEFGAADDQGFRLTVTVPLHVKTFAAQAALPSGGTTTSGGAA